MRFLLLNQFGPPDPAPTARLLGDLAERLRRDGHEVEILSSGQAYRARGGSRAGRWARELGGLGRLLWRALRVRPRPDAVICLSSPPGLPVLAALAARHHRARLVHWAMDLYPEIALALGEIRPGRLADLVGRLMRWAYAECAFLVALDEDMAERLRPHGRPVEIIAPWPPAELVRTAVATERDFRETLWIYSGNLGRAHEWETLIEAQDLLEHGGIFARLVIQGGGAGYEAAKADARRRGLKRCEFHGYADNLLPSLLSASALVITQRPETRGLLWPSKLAVARELPRPIAFIGPTDGAIARSLRDRPQTACFAPGQSEALADWVCALPAPDLGAPLPDFAALRERAIDRWIELLRRQGSAPA